MYMIGVTANFYYMTFELVANASKVTMQFLFHRWVNEMFPMFGAEYDVYIILY